MDGKYFRSTIPKGWQKRKRDKAYMSRRTYAQSAAEAMTVEKINPPHPPHCNVERQSQTSARAIINIAMGGRGGEKYFGNTFHQPLVRQAHSVFYGSVWVCVFSSGAFRKIVR